VKIRTLAVGTFVLYLATAGSNRAQAAVGERRAEDAWQDAPSPRQTQQPVRRFDIPAGSLDEILARFQDLTGVKVIASETLRTLPSPGVTGDFTAEQALHQLLAGTSVSFRFNGPDTVALDLRLRERIDVTAFINKPSSPKLTEILRDTPQTIVVVPRAVLQEQNATTLRDVLRNVTGITMQAGEGGVPAGDQMSIRGFSTRTDMFVDGVRDFGGYSRDTFNVEQVEVAKGPASTLVGRGSTGGAINLVSKAPVLRSARGFNLGLGSAEYKRGSFDVNQPLAGVGVSNAALRLNAMWTDADVPGRNAVANKRWGVAPSLTFGLGTPTRFTASYFHLGQDNVPDYGQPWVNAASGPLAELNGGRPPVDGDRFYGILARDYEKTDTDLATGVVEHDFSPGLTLRNQLRWGRTNRDSVITAPRFVDVLSPDLYTQINRQFQSRDMEDTILSNQLSLTSRFTTGPVSHALVAGVELAREGSVNYARTAPAAPVADLFNPNPGDPYTGAITRTGAVNDANADSATVFAFDTVNVSRKLALTGGLRYDHFAVDFDATAITGITTPFSRTDDLLSWKAGAVFRPQPFGSVYAGVGNSFNPSAEGLSLAANNVELAPEETRSYEVGTKWDVAQGRLSLVGAIFRTEKTNARTPGINPGDPPLVLDGRQRVDGVEVGAQGKLGSRIDVFTGYTHMWSEITGSNTAAELGNALAQTPEDTFSLWANVQLSSQASVGGGAVYMDSVYRNALNTLRAPSYWLWSATAAYAVSRQLTLRVNGQNLAGADYVDRVGGGHFVPGAGRSLTISAQLDF
jgi:catecholate siderophore receptor